MSMCSQPLEEKCSSYRLEFLNVQRQLSHAFAISCDWLATGWLLPLAAVLSATRQHVGAEVP